MNLPPILLSNFLHPPFTYLGVMLVQAIYLEQSGETIGLIDRLWAAGMLTFYYGAMYWLGFILVILTLDVVFFRIVKFPVKLGILMEWLVISVPFIVWALEYDYMLWFFVVGFFGISQFFRAMMLRRTIIPEAKSVEL